MAGQHGGRAPQLSPDGRWRWDGQQWTAVNRAPTQVPPQPVQTTPRLPHQSRRFWIVGGSVAGALVLLSVCSAAVSARPGAAGAQPAAAATTPRPEPAVGTSDPTPTATATAVPTATPTPTGTTATSATTSAPPKQRSVRVPAAPPPTHKAAPPPAQPAAPAPPDTCGAPSNPWGYNFCDGSVIGSPNSGFCSYFNCIPSFWESTNGYVEQCADGTFSHSGGVPGSCSSHAGDLRPLYQ